MKKTTLFCVILLLFLFVLSFTAMLQTSVTSDEPNYITAGYSYWKTGDFRLNFEHPPLAKLIAGFPLVFLKPNLSIEASIDTSFESPVSNISDLWVAAAEPDKAYVLQWFISKHFFFDSENNPERLLFFARLPFLLLGIIAGFYVFKWARELYGETAGIFALFLYAFCPLIVAYMHLAITDFALTVFFFISVYYFWRWRKDGKEKTVRMLILCGIFFGLANATKLTGLYLIPIFAVLLAIELLIDILVYKIEKQDKQKRLFFAAIGFFSIILIGFVVVSSTYLFVNLPYYKDALFISTIHSEGGHPAYLLGEYSTSGWWYYFIVAFFVKTPLPFIIFLFASLFVSIFASLLKIPKICHCNDKFLLSSELILIIPPIIYFTAFMINQINIGIRHILPIYPFLFVFASKIILSDYKLLNYNLLDYNLLDYKQKWRQRSFQLVFKLVFITLCLWYFISTIFFFPNYLSYFNELIGGANNGQKVLLDSNIDWGQDVGKLNKWLEKHNLKNESIYYSVFTIQPVEYLGIHNKTIKCMPHPGLFVVSLNRLYDLGQIKHGCLEWLKQREPTEKIGYSIFIYNITEPELLEQEFVCTKECQDVCSVNNKTYRDYIFVEQCICACD